MSPTRSREVSPEQHLAQPWRVHTLAQDFQLLDVWQFELGGALTLDAFVPCFFRAMQAMTGSLLSRLRLVLGRVFGWDAGAFTLKIPGSDERSVFERLTPEERVAGHGGPDVASPLPAADLRVAYVLADEALYEVSNDTIHALIHLGVPRGAAHATMAVYIKSRGTFSRLYMAGIGPFRHLAVYPALMREVEKAWAGRELKR